jgi:hypothetical protein
MQTLRRLNGIAAVFAAGAVLIFADGGALAKGNNGGNHDHGQDHSDHSQMKIRDFKSDHSDKHADKHKDGEMRADRHKDDKHKDKAQAEKTKDKDKDKTTTTSTTTANGNTPAPASDKDLAGKGIVGSNTELKPVPGSAAPGTPAPGATPGPTAVNNTIHPIPGSAAPPPAPVLGSGKGIIRVTDQGGNSFILPDHGTGVTVTNAGPGHVTISNGVDSRTVSGIALTISGAKTVSVDKSLGTGRPPADGSTVVLTPNGTVTNDKVLPDGSFEANAGGQHYP